MKYDFFPRFLKIYLVDFFYALKQIRAEGFQWLLLSSGIFLTTAAISLTFMIANISIKNTQKVLESQGLYVMKINISKIGAWSESYMQAQILAETINNWLGSRGVAYVGYVANLANIGSTVGPIKADILALPIRNIGYPLVVGSFENSSFNHSSTSACLLPLSLAFNLDEGKRTILNIQNRLSCEVMGSALIDPDILSLFKSRDVVVVPLEFLINSNWSGLSQDHSQLSILIKFDRNLKLDALSKLYASLSKEVNNSYFKNTILSWTGSEIGHFAEMINQILSIVVFVGVLLWLITGIGISSTLLQAMRLRTSEIGIRLAVGANQKNIKNQFLFEALILILSGVIAGWLVSTVSVYIYSVLFDINYSFSITPYVITFLGAFISVFFAISIPLFRLSRMDPASVIRNVR